MFISLLPTKMGRVPVINWELTLNHTVIIYKEKKWAMAGSKYQAQQRHPPR